MEWHGAVMSLSKRETERYDAIARANNLTRAQVIRQLAAEGLVERGRRDADRVDGRGSLE